MTPDQEKSVFEFLDHMEPSRKSFDAEVEWELENHRSGPMLSYFVALKLEGVLGGGVSLRLKTPQSTPDRDVYGHLEIKHPFSTSRLRISAIEWLPRRLHTNSANAPAAHKFQTLKDRIHQYDINRNLGQIGIFLQKDRGVAVPFPRAIGSFEDYIKLGAEIWNCPDVKRIPPPPWSETLF